MTLPIKTEKETNNPVWARRSATELIRLSIGLLSKGCWHLKREAPALGGRFI
jgi:hypothetical protein